MVLHFDLYPAGITCRGFLPLKKMKVPIGRFSCRLSAGSPFPSDLAIYPENHAILAATPLTLKARRGRTAKLGCHVNGRLTPI